MKKRKKSTGQNQILNNSIWFTCCVFFQLIMARIYVEDTNGLSCDRWNIYSTVAEGYIFDEWCSFGELVAFVIDEQTKSKIEEMSSLMTERKKVNYITREELENERIIRR